MPGRHPIDWEAAELDGFLRDLTARRYAADRFVHAACACGSDRFQLEVDAEEGCARRTCATCREPHLICDSAEYWDEATPKGVVCGCGNRKFLVAVAFSHRKEGDVRWITVGHRCVACGVLGSTVDWKVDYGPTDHLYGRV